MVKEAKARIKINKLLEEAGWRFFDEQNGKANISLENNTKITESHIDALGENFDKTKNGLNNSSAKLLPEGTVIVSTRATIGRVGIARTPLATNQGFKNIIIKDRSQVIPEYIAYMIKQLVPKMEAMATGGTFKEISKSAVALLKIPLPPLKIQQEIVAEIEGYQKIIDGARAVVENYKPQIQIDPEWEMVKLGDVCDFKRGPFGGSLKKDIFVESGYAVYEQSHAIYDQFENIRYFIDETKFNEMRGFQVNPGDLIMSCSGTMGKVAIVPNDVRPGIINQALLKLTPKKTIMMVFLKLWMESNNFQESLDNLTFGAAIKNVASVKVLKELVLPLPNLETQTQIVAQIAKEQSLVDANKELITLFEQKIKDKIASVWGEDE